MSYIKDIIQSMSEISVEKFYSEPLESMDPKYVELMKSIVSDCIDSKKHLDTFRREFSTVKLELDNPGDAKEFANYINDRSSHLNTKFNFVYFPNSLSDTIMICANILRCIDGELNHPGSHYVEAEKYYNLLKSNLANSWETIICRLGLKEDEFNKNKISFVEAIKFLAHPYMRVSSGVIQPVDSEYMYKLLFDQDVMIYDYFIFDEHEPIGSYCFYGDMFNVLNYDMLNSHFNNNILSKEIKTMYIKTIITMRVATNILEDYLFDIQDFCKKYYLACAGDYTIEIDSHFNVINENDYPSMIHDFDWRNNNILVGERSSEADTDAGALSQQSTSMTPTTTTNNMSLDNIDEKYKQKSLKLQKLINDVFKVNKEKLKAKLNESFFRKWIGRVPSMYQHYANSAQMYENRMKGDPTQILLNEGVNYLKEMTSRTESIFNELINTCKKVTSAGDIQGKVNAVKGFCKQYPIEDISAEPKTVKQQIVNEACYRIADAILQENGVYGYTAEGIVQNKKFPTSNHIVTSLFVENAQEKAEEQSVSSIFSSPDSITVFATPEKLNVLESGFRQTTNAIMSNFNPRLISSTQKNMHQNYKLYVNNLSRRASAQGASEEIDGDVGQTKKIAKALEDGLIDALDVVIEQKKRCIQCVGSMYEMGGRIANLAKRCIAAMHDEEAKHRDNSFNTGSNSARLNRSTKRASKQNMYNSGQNKSIAQIKREAMMNKIEAARNAPRYGGRVQ